MNTNPFEFSFPAAPDWTETQAEREAQLAERTARLERLKLEVGNLQERTESLAFELKMGLITELQFENNSSALRERIEACEVELGIGSGAAAKSLPEGEQ